MLWVLPLVPGRHASVLFSFEVTRGAGAGRLLVTLTIADVVTTPPLALDSHGGREFQRIMARAVAILGDRAPRDAARFTFRIEEHADGTFAVAFGAGGVDELLRREVEEARADELGRLMEEAVHLLAAASDEERFTRDWHPVA
jgi:hypothetical protein